VPMMHLLLTVPRDRYRENARRLAEEDGMWIWPNGTPTGDPDVLRFELSVGRATLRHSAGEIASVLGRLVR
jgi:hypothetical protein